jgi:SAM-dependent methyltransferase
MNQEHLQGLASEEWATYLRETLLPWTVGDLDLGPTLLEIGPGPGRTTELLRTRTDHLTAVEVDPALASALQARLGGDDVTVVEADAAAMPFEDASFSGAASFVMLHHVPDTAHQDRVFAEVARVLRPGAWFVAADGLDSEDLASRHTDDVYNPIDPATLPARLAAAGFSDITTARSSTRWRVAARRAETLEQRLQRVEDQTAIAELKAAYCAACDADHDADAIAALFAAGAVWHRAGEEPCAGPEAIRAYMDRIRRSGRMVRTAHMITNPVVHVHGDEATGRWRLLMLYTASDGRYHRIIGHYRDRFVRVGGRWRFRSLYVTVEESGPYDAASVLAS